MSIKNLLAKIFQTKNNNNVAQPELNRERIAAHEAAHGVVWYLFKDKWTVNSLTIERNGLPDERMNGALHITANFDVNGQNSIERANELFAIALAGLVGQNTIVLHQRENLLLEIMAASHFSQVLDESGCGGDYEIAREYLTHLGNVFQTSEGAFTKYKICDLVSMFQDHRKVQQVHARLTLLLIEKGTLSRVELINFFEGENFQEYIEEENLDINFFHRR